MTILFSDIVTFTNIAAACPAMAVVNMLNDMYQRFDAATVVHGVYKVTKAAYVPSSNIFAKKLSDHQHTRFQSVIITK